MLIKYIFIVLHYNEETLKDTFECIDSIKNNIKNKNYKIIVVENGSQDKSEYKLKLRYKNSNKIDIVISKKNLGFAKGNNLGCKHAIASYNPQYLIVINNDTYIKQTNFLEEIEREYIKSEFHILGPYIYDKNLMPQNPNLNLRKNIEEVDKEIKFKERMLIKLDKNSKKKKLSLFYLIVQTLDKNPCLENFIRRILKKEKNRIDEEASKYKKVGVGLHGAALIFSKRYYSKYREVFYPQTFMFIEEDILYNRVKKDNLISVYNPNLKIYHKEDSSTDATLKSNMEKKVFILKNSLYSLKILKKLMEEGEVHEGNNTSRWEGD